MLEKNNIQENVSLAPFTTYKIGGDARYFIRATTNECMEKAISFAIDRNIPWFVLGLGANILVSDAGFPGLVIKNESSRMRIEHSNGQVYLRTSSGTTIEHIISHTVPHGYGGFEHFAGIPSTVGGALWQNLHFLSPDRNSTVFLGDTLVHAVVFDTVLREKKTLSKEQFLFGYDTSVLHQGNLLVFDSVFLLQDEDPRILQDRVLANLAWRNERHPPYQTEFSCGSVFKKHATVGAGRLIDDCGLKGFRIGGAMVSPKHANFIINTGSATAKQVYSLMNYIQKSVFEEKGIYLEPEIRFIGTF